VGKASGQPIIDYRIIPSRAWPEWMYAVIKDGPKVQQLVDLCVELRAKQPSFQFHIVDSTSSIKTLETVYGDPTASEGYLNRHGIADLMKQVVREDPRFRWILITSDNRIVSTFMNASADPSGVKGSNDSTPDSTPVADLPPSKVINTQSDFEHSEFCRLYDCKRDQQYPSKHHAYYNTSAAHLTVEIETDIAHDPNVIGLGLSFHWGDHLTSKEFDIISALIRSTNEAVKHDRAMTFVKRNVEEVVCDTCSVPTDGKSIMDGKFRITVGTVGNEQIVSLDKKGL